MTAPAPWQVHVSTARVVTVSAEGGLHTIEQIRTLASLGGDLPGWARTALYVDEGLRHCPDLPVEEVLRVAFMGPSRALVKSPRLWPMLARDPNVDVRRFVAELVGTVADPRAEAVAVALASDPSAQVRRLLVTSPALPHPAAMLLAKDEESEVVVQLALKTIHPDVLVAAMGALSDDDLMHVLRNRYSWPEEAVVFAVTHPCEQVRIWFAAQQSTPLVLLRAMTGDADLMVAQRAAHTLRLAPIDGLGAGQGSL